MAIIDALPGVSVEVTVNGEALKEHEDQELEEERRTVTRYIEATSGQIFAVRLRINRSFTFSGDCISFKIYVDGECVHSPLMRKSDQWTRISEGKDSDCGTRVSKYRFASLETVSDGHTTLGELSRLREVGTIKVRCAHHQIQGPGRRSAVESGSTPGFISEKALKGRTLSHSVEFAPEIEHEVSPVLRTTSVRGQPDPAATFVFCYRALDALRSMLIIRRNPTSPPLEERDFTSLNQDELKEMQKRYRELVGRDVSNARIKREIKRERADDNPRPRKIARPRVGDTQLEIDEDGRFRESSVSTLVGEERIVIELD